MSTPGDNSSRHSHAGEPPLTRARTSRDPTPSSGDGPARDLSRAPTPSDAVTEGAGTNVVEIDDDVEVGEKRKVGPKLKSKVWEDFDKIKVSGKWKAQCHWCKKMLVAEGRSGTGHLQSHLNTCESRQARKGLKQSTLKL